MTDEDAKNIISTLKEVDSSLYLISDKQPDMAYLKTKNIIESTNLFCQERLFTISFQAENNNSNKQLSDRFRNGGTMLKDLAHLGFFIDELHMIMNASITMSHAPPRLIRHNSIQPHGRHAVVTASGPSLKNMYQDLSFNRSKFDLFCCFSTLRSLLKASIVPDYHCNQERHACHIPLLSDSLCKELVSDMTLLCSANNDPRMNTLYSDSVAFFRSASTASALYAQRFEDVIQGEGVQVLNLAIVYAVLLGYRTIHLVGTDLGIINHEETRDPNALASDLREYDIQHKGNLRDYIYTNKTMIDVADYIGMLINGSVLPNGEALTTY